MTGKFLISMTFAIAYLYTAELFPTKVRNLAVGLASTFARIGSISAPYIVDLLVSSKSNTKCIGPKLQCHAFVSFGNSSGVTFFFKFIGQCSCWYPSGDFWRLFHQRWPLGTHVTRNTKQEIARKRSGSRTKRKTESGR